MCHGQILGDAVRRARTEHHCDECGGAIKPGKKYRRYVYLESRGDPIHAQLQCARCYGLMRVVLDDDAGDACYFVGELRSTVAGMIRGNASMARAVRAQIRAAMEEFK